MLLNNISVNWGIWSIIGFLSIAAIVYAFRKLSPVFFLVLLTLFCSLLFFGFKGWQYISNSSKELSGSKEKTTLPGYIGKGEPIALVDSVINFPLREYKVKDEKFWSYKTTGDWKWHEDFVASFYDVSGWSYKRNGNFIIGVHYRGHSEQGASNGAQSYTYNGGPIEITINGQVCCCEKRLTIPKGINGIGIKEQKANLQEAITKTMLEQKDYAIKLIMECL